METLTNQRMHKKQKDNGLLNIRTITMIGVLSGISVVLMLFQLPVWFAPDFYKIDLSEVPILIGAFALGPIAGVLMELIKNLLNLAIDGTTTSFIGEIANFIMGCAFVVPSAIIYKRKKSLKSAMIGLTVGILCLVLAGSLLNAYVLLPVYAKVYGAPIDAFVKMGTAVNSGITSLSTLVLFAVAPFNLLKGAINVLLTILLYKRISPIIKKQN